MQAVIEKSFVMGLASMSIGVKNAMNHPLLPHRVVSTPTTSWHVFCEGNEDMAIDSNRSLFITSPSASTSDSC